MERYERVKRIVERVMVINFFIVFLVILIIGFFRVLVFKVFFDDLRL